MYQNILDNVKKYCIDRGLLKENMGIVAGLSGGADSVFLLEALRELQNQFRLRICAVHVNHGIRGEEAARDELFSERYAEGMGIPFRKFMGDVPMMAAEWHMSVEEAGREFRYRCLEDVRQELGYDVIAVAHHRDDQAETILLHMLRGSGLRGMGGMLPRRDRIIRPLLCVGKEEILEALAERGIGFCQDSTNEEIRYRRNKIRWEVLPLLQEVQEGAAEHLARLGEEMQEVAAYLEGQAEACCQELVREEKGCLKVEADAFLPIPNVLQREVAMRLLARMAGRRRDRGSVHVAKFRELFAGGTGRSLDLPYGLRAWREYGWVFLGKRSGAAEPGDGKSGAAEPGDGESEVAKPGEDVSGWSEELCLGSRVSVMTSRGEEWILRAMKKEAERFSAANLKKCCTKCFDYDRMDTMPRFRYWEPGDFLWLDRKGRRKKLNRIFVDEKIPVADRRRIPILAMGSHVLWIPELNRQSAFFYVTEETQEVLCIERLIECNIE